MITGRVVDSGGQRPLVHEFGWAWDDYDRLARPPSPGTSSNAARNAPAAISPPTGSWVPDYEQYGFPIVDIEADGRFVVTKAPGTGGWSAN